MARDTQILDALKLAEGRLTLLLPAVLPESDHPGATEYVIAEVRDAIKLLNPTTGKVRVMHYQRRDFVIACSIIHDKGWTNITQDRSKVTCKLCRNTLAFKISKVL